MLIKIYLRISRVAAQAKKQIIATALPALVIISNASASVSVSSGRVEYGSFDAGSQTRAYFPYPEHLHEVCDKFLVTTVQLPLDQVQSFVLKTVKRAVLTYPYQKILPKFTISVLDSHVPYVTEFRQKNIDPINSSTYASVYIHFAQYLVPENIEM